MSFVTEAELVRLHQEIPSGVLVLQDNFAITGPLVIGKHTYTHLPQTRELIRADALALVETWRREKSPLCPATLYG